MKKLVLTLALIFILWFMANNYWLKESNIATNEPAPPDMAIKVQEFESQTEELFSSLNSVTAALTLVLNETGQNNPMGDAEQSLVLLTRYKDKLSGLNAPAELAGVQSKYTSSLYSYIEALEMIKSVVESGRVNDLDKLKQKLEQAQASREEGDQTLKALKTKYKAK